MNTDERICCIALTLCPGVGIHKAKLLVDMLGSAAAVFEQRRELPALVQGATDKLVKALDCPEAFARAEREMEFVEKNGLVCLTPDSKDYPRRLYQCPDAPLALFYRGNTALNRRRVVSMVGTRRASDYGTKFCADFLHDLSTLCPDILIVSGLAYGIDIHSHRAALANGMDTVGVLAHGLDRIYPSSHRKTAVAMLSQGGLLTEFLSGTEPDGYHFVSRNRIVAGMCDATIVVESAKKGGALITAGLAVDYNRDCFAVPGRVGDALSEGCNALIRDQKAALLQSAEEFLKAMGWQPSAQSAGEGKAVQCELFPELSPEEDRIVCLLAKGGKQHIDVLAREAELPVSRVSALLFELEMKGVAKAVGGGMYCLAK